jgi:hypothetical protein
MNVVWPVTALFGTVIILWLYIFYRCAARNKMHEHGMHGIRVTTCCHWHYCGARDIVPGVDTIKTLPSEKEATILASDVARPSPRGPLDTPVLAIQSEN